MDTDSTPERDRGSDREPDGEQDGREVSEVAELGQPGETALGGADAVPETPDDNNPERDVPRTPHGSHGNPPRTG